MKDKITNGFPLQRLSQMDITNHLAACCLSEMASFFTSSSTKFIGTVALYLTVLSGTAFAQDAAIDLPQLSSTYIKDQESFRLAANGRETLVKKSGSAPPVFKKSEVEPEIFSGSNAHKYLGLATIVGVALTAVNKPPENECESASCPPPEPRDTRNAHASYARATVVLAAAAVTTGLIAHWDDFHFEDGITDPDNLHALLGAAGMLTMAYAVSKASDPNSSNGHAGKGIAGAVMMAAAIKITW